MLTIRPEQLAALSQSLQQRFEDKLAVHLEAFLEQKGKKADPAYVRDQIQRGLPTCDEFGLERQCDVARYFEIVLGSMGGFTDEPFSKDALNILYGYRVDPELKLQRLQQWADKEGR